MNQSPQQITIHRRYVSTCQKMNAFERLQQIYIKLIIFSFNECKQMNELKDEIFRRIRQFYIQLRQIYISRQVFFSSLNHPQKYPILQKLTHLQHFFSLSMNNNTKLDSSITQPQNYQNEQTQSLPIQQSLQLPISQQTSKLQTIQQSIEDDELDSSDQQTHQYLKIHSKQPQQQKQVVNVLDMIEESQPIEKKNIKADSLQHDIKLGWIPKTQVTGPIPVSFSHDFLDAIIQEKIQQRLMIYLGYRPTNTFEIHQKFYESGNKYPFYQFHLCKSQFLERFFKKYYSGYEFNSERKVGMVTEEQRIAPSIQQDKDKQPQQQPVKLPKHLIFDSQYQGGNLDAVYYEEDEYRLMVRVDSNTRGHCNYYNFKITCLKSGLYRFRIMNMSKKKSLYERGLKPYIKILNPKGKHEDQWQQRDESICPKVKFGPSPLNQFLQDGGQFYSLKFQLQLKNQTQYQICYNIPYTYSELIQMITQIRDNKNLHVHKLGYSLSGVQIPLFTISENDQTKDQPEQQKKQENDNYFVVITGRIHPGESNGSHIVNGLVKFLLKDNPEYKRLKKNIVFKIIPMLNPDGVICGNTRTGFAGKDLNRKFSGKVQFIFPEVNNIKDYVMKLKEKQGKKLLFVIDIHGHSNRKGSFFFGPQYPILDEQYTKCRLLPRLYAARSQAFRYYSCKFKISSGKQATSRGYFNSNGVRTYTHQTSIHSYYDFKERKDLPFTRKTLENLGKDLALAILDYIEKMRIQAARLKAQLKNPPNKKQQPTKQSSSQIPIQAPKQQQRDSDKMPSDKADSQSEGDDIDQKELNVFYQKINQNREYFYEEILKSMNNTKDSLTSPVKEKKTKPKQLQKQKDKDKEKEVKKDEDKKQKTKWNTKVTYTPKKTLFDEYSKLSNASVSKSTTFRTTNSIIPKFKSTVSPDAILKRQKQEKETQDILMSFQRVKLQGSSNRIIYSVPNIKWDYSAPKNSVQSLPNNEIYRYDLNDYSHVELQHKKDKMKQTRYFANAQIMEKQLQREERQPKINKQLLQQLLQPSSNLFVTKDKIINESKLLPLKQQSQKAQKSPPQNNEKLFSMHDPKKGLSLAEMKRRASIMEDMKRQKIDSQIRPHAQTKKQQYLCKKWQKQIVLKTRRSMSLSNKVLYSDSKGVPVVNVGKNVGFQIGRNSIYQQRLSSQVIKESDSPFRKETLPKINLTKKDIIVIKNSDIYTS